MDEPIIIVDSHAVGHSSKHSYGGLSYRGVHTGVIYGFLIKVLSLADKFQTRRFVFTWDSGRSYRRDLYPLYKVKEGEEKTEEEKEIDHQARFQFSQLRTQILPELGFTNIFIQTGIEADDIIAALVTSTDGEDKIVVSDDKDLYQLLDHCSIFKVKKKTLYTKEDLKREWDCDPTTWKEMKALAGCTGDCVPNIPGVKEKTAIAYLNGSLRRGKKFTEIVRYRDSEKAFLERNKRLTWLPFEGTKTPNMGTFGGLDMMAVMRVCDSFGLSSLLKGKYYRIWDFLCKGGKHGKKGGCRK